MSSTAMPRDLTEQAVTEFSQVSSTDRIAAVAEALEHNGIRDLRRPVGRRSEEDGRFVDSSWCRSLQQHFTHTRIDRRGG